MVLLLTNLLTTLLGVLGSNEEDEEHDETPTVAPNVLTDAVDERTLRRQRRAARLGFVQYDPAAGESAMVSTVMSVLSEAVLERVRQWEFARDDYVL